MFVKLSITQPKCSLYCVTAITAGEQGTLIPSICPWTRHDLPLPQKNLTIILRDCDLVCLLSIHEAQPSPVEGLAGAIYSRERYRFAISPCTEGNNPGRVRSVCLYVHFLLVTSKHIGQFSLNWGTAVDISSRQMVKKRKEILFMIQERNGRNSSAGFFCFIWQLCLDFLCLLHIYSFKKILCTVSQKVALWTLSFPFPSLSKTISLICSFYLSLEPLVKRRCLASPARPTSGLPPPPAVHKPLL